MSTKDQHHRDLRIKTCMSRYCYLEDELNEASYVMRCFNASFNIEFHDDILAASHRSTLCDAPSSQQAIVLDIGITDCDETTHVCSPQRLRLARIMYKRLALSLHPDKNGGRNSIFLQVQEAYRSNDTLKLFMIASKEGIDLDGMNLVEDDIESSITTIEDKLKTIKNSIVWAWYSASECDRSVVRQQIVDTLGKVGQTSQS